jgi:1-acyl-sn-glycerol-3-phosphate acyltransferase
MRTTEIVTPLETLIQINTDDMLGAFGLKEWRRGRGLLELLCRRPARRFAEQILYYDQLVGQQGLSVGASWVLQTFRNRLTVRGAEHLPAQGAVLIVSNHPGLTDTVALFTTIARRDLQTIAADRPFLRALPNTSRHLIYVDGSASHNLPTVRAASRHLQQGGALLTFPAGKIEPDPAVLPGAVAALADWSASIALFTRLAPATTVIPVLVSGVLSPRAQQHPLRYLRRTRKDREWLAAMLQLIVPAYQPVDVNVTFAPPLQSAQHPTPTTWLTAVRHAMQQLIQAEQQQRSRSNPSPLSL